MKRLKEPASYNPAVAATLAAIGNVLSSSPYTLFASGLNVDALFQGTGSSLPPAVILDYVYGVAAYRCWSSGHDVDDVHVVVESYHRGHYALIPVPPRPSSNDSDNTPSEELDDHNDLHFIPDRPVDSHDHPPPTSSQRRRYTSTKRGDVMAKAMDELNLILMVLHRKRLLTEGRSEWRRRN